MAKHAAPYDPTTLDIRDFVPSTSEPKHRAQIGEGFVPIRDAWATADDIKQQRHDFEFEQFQKRGL